MIRFVVVLIIRLLVFGMPVYCLLKTYFELQSIRQLATFASDKNGKRVEGC